MAKSLTLEQAGKVFIWFIGSTALLFLGPRWAEQMIFDPQASPSIRYLGVALSVLSLVPWLAYAGWGLSIADEYNRKTLVTGTAVSFALAIVFSIAGQLVADAHLIAAPLTINLPIGFLLWAAGVGLTALVFRVRSGP